MKTSLFSFLFLAMLGTVSAQGNRGSEERPSITVTGEAIVRATPDRILINLGIETWDASLAAAKKKNNEILALTVKALRASGVEDKYIQTDNLSIEPRWNDEHRKESFIGYFVRNGLQVTVGDAGSVETVVTRVLEAGVTHVHGIEFQTAAYKTYREQARELALEAAREKAVKMAGALDESIGRPIRIEERTSGPSSWFWSGWSG